MTSSGSIIYSVFICVLLQVNDLVFFIKLHFILCHLLQISTSEARSAEDRLKLIVSSEFETLSAVLKEYFLDSRIDHDSLVSDTQDYIQDFRNRFFKNYNFSSPRVTSCLRQHLQTEGPIEAHECAQDEAYDSLRRQVFENVTYK